MSTVFDRSEAFDRNWPGPEDCKPRCYRNQTEKDIWHSIAVHNEYRLGELQPHDVVIDIGANIGAFSWLSYRNGSRSICAFEIDPWNYDGLLQNIAGMEDGIGANLCAVVRGDEHRAKTYHYAGAWNSFGANGIAVPSCSLDEIIERVGNVRFLKTDCEGCEWPILYTSTQLAKVQEIAGEYHLIDTPESLASTEMQNLPYPISVNALEQFLQDQGFNTQFKQSTEKIGNFWAWKRNAA